MRDFLFFLLLLADSRHFFFRFDHMVVCMSAYTILQYPLLLLAGGVFYLVFVFAGGQLVDISSVIMDTFPNTITQQTIDAIQFPLRVLVASPALVLIVIGGWALIKTITENS